MMKAMPTISAKEMADKPAVSYSTIRRDINILMQEKKTRREGADKTGQWIVCR
ncbi:HTH domain-containing protein [Alloprevotella sp. OH1205_COT-284]|nr:HTH domain-containing protein [Alloprevotella sp. OH1205_COT-284]